MTTARMDGEASAFARWQPIYAELGVATFPVRITPDEKKPAVRNYLKIGCSASQALVARFGSADAFGFAAGKPSGITVLDVDTKDERVLADAMVRHGRSPLLVRSGSGNFQAWYRWNGERRSIRPIRDIPIDILGAGYVVAPPSRAARGRYEIIQGSLDDLRRLPPLENLGPPSAVNVTATKGGRNNALWKHCMRQAHACDDFAALLDVARGFNEDALLPPLSEEEVVKTARSAWETTERGCNRFGQHGAWLPLNDVQRLAHDPHLLALLSWLRAHNGPDSVFLVADGLREILKWPRRQFTQARRRAVEQQWVLQVSRPAPGRAAQYVWGRPASPGFNATAGVKREGKGGVLVEDSLPNPAGVGAEGVLR